MNPVRHPRPLVTGMAIVVSVVATACGDGSLVIEPPDLVAPRIEFLNRFTDFAVPAYLSLMLHAQMDAAEPAIQEEEALSIEVSTERGDAETIFLRKEFCGEPNEFFTCHGVSVRVGDQTTVLDASVTGQMDRIGGVLRSAGNHYQGGVFLTALPAAEAVNYARGLTSVMRAEPARYFSVDEGVRPEHWVTGAIRAEPGDPHPADNILQIEAGESIDARYVDGHGNMTILSFHWGEE